MTIASSNYLKIGLGEAKDKYESLINSSTSKKATLAPAYLKNYFVSDFNQKYAILISDSDSTTLA